MPACSGIVLIVSRSRSLTAAELVGVLNQGPPSRLALGRSIGSLEVLRSRISSTGGVMATDPLDLPDGHVHANLPDGDHEVLIVAVRLHRHPEHDDAAVASWPPVVGMVVVGDTAVVNRWAPASGVGEVLVDSRLVCLCSAGSAAQAANLLDDDDRLVRLADTSHREGFAEVAPIEESCLLITPGEGVGGYPVHIGLDSRGTPCAMLIDFEIIGQTEQVGGEREEECAADRATSAFAVRARPRGARNSA